MKTKIVKWLSCGKVWTGEVITEYKGFIHVKVLDSMNERIWIKEGDIIK